MNKRTGDHVISVVRQVILRSRQMYEVCIRLLSVTASIGTDIAQIGKIM